MTEQRKRLNTVPRWAKQARTLTESLAIKPERFLALGTILTESIKNDGSAPDTILTIIGLRRDGKLSDEEAAFLLFDLGWMTGLNAITQVIDKEIMGWMFFNKDTGELESA